MSGLQFRRERRTDRQTDRERETRGGGGGEAQVGRGGVAGVTAGERGSDVLLWLA